MTSVKNKVRAAADALGGRYHESQRGVPLVEMMQHRATRDSQPINYSVCYFGKSNSWRIFWPYLAFNGEQNRATYTDFNDVVKFFSIGERA